MYCLCIQNFFLWVQQWSSLDTSLRKVTCIVYFKSCLNIQNSNNILKSAQVHHVTSTPPHHCLVSWMLHVFINPNKNHAWIFVCDCMKDPPPPPPPWYNRNWLGVKHKFTYLPPPPPPPFQTDQNPCLELCLWLHERDPLTPTPQKRNGKKKRKEKTEKAQIPFTFGNCLHQNLPGRNTFIWLKTLYKCQLVCLMQNLRLRS